MAEEINIISPPFPQQSPTIMQLHQKLEDLRTWIIQMREQLSETPAEIPFPRELPEEEHFAQLGVMIHSTHVMFLGSFRAEWDNLVRSYEEAWTCTVCLRRQAELVTTAAQFLGIAFIDMEKREAKFESWKRRQRRFHRKMQKYIEKNFGDEGGEDWDSGQEENDEEE